MEDYGTGVGLSGVAFGRNRNSQNLNRPMKPCPPAFESVSRNRHQKEQTQKLPNKNEPDVPVSVLVECKHGWALCCRSSCFCILC